MLEKFKEFMAKYSAKIIFIIILLAIGLIIGGGYYINYLRNQISIEKEEAERIQINFDASQDTIRVFKDKNGNMVSEISAYKIKIDEMDTKYKNLFSLYVKEKNKPPVYIVEYKTKLDEKLTNISTVVSDTAISFIDSVVFNDGNYRAISGYIPYKITYHVKKDLVNKFAFEQALYYAYVLEENGCEDPEIIAFKDEVKISIKEALKDKQGKGIIYRIEILKNPKRLSLEDISDKYKIDEKLLTEKYDKENKTFVYYVGNIIPFQNVEPIIEEKDLNTFASLYTYPANLRFSQGMKVYTGLYYDQKTKKPMINIKTNYPGLEFTSIVGADIMQEESKKVLRGFRKEFGVGLNVGYGLSFYKDMNGNYILKPGPTISIGLNWSPRFLQFGPNK